MRFSIIDPAMDNGIGHHRQMNLVLARELQRRGHQATIYCSKSYRALPEDAQLGFAIVPAFSEHPYGRQPAPEEGDERRAQDDLSATTLRQELERLMLGDAAIAPTSFPHVITAFAQARSVPLFACLQHHPELDLHHAPESWQRCFAHAYAAGKTVSLFVLESGLRQAFAALLPRGQRISLMPFPAATAALPPKDALPMRIGFLGGLRKEQGLKSLPEFVNIALSHGFKVLIQDSGNKLANAPHPSVEVFGRVERMEDIFPECAAIVLNYSPHFYGRMGSGLAWESILHGTPVLYSRQTLAAAHAAEFGVGLAFDYCDAASFSAAIAQCRRKLADVRAASRKAAMLARKKHGIEHFVTELARLEAWPNG